jgi:hypothetical protein
MRSGKTAINANGATIQSMFILKNTIKESATAGTLCHGVKFGIQKAFYIAFEMTCTTKLPSTTQAAKRCGITQKTSWFFMQKVRLAMKSSKQFPMMGNVQVDEFVVGGK